MTAAEEAIEVIGATLFESAHAITMHWPLDAIIESPLNPRRHYDPRAMEELVQSLQRTGQITPGLARPVPGSTVEWQGDHYQVVELAAGHRRFRALSTMGEQTMRLELREMADEEFLEILTIENCQRDDLDAMEEAEGYRLLMDRIGYDVGRVADRVGRARSYVYDRLRLLQLVPEAQEWLREGRIFLGHAVVLSRLSADQQRRVIGGPERDYRQGGLWVGEYLPGLLDQDREMPRDDEPEEPLAHCRPATVAALQHWVDHHIRLDLAADVAPELFPEAVAVEQTAEPIRVTYEHQVHPEARSAEGERTWCARSWKRADGLYGSVTCEHAQPAIIVVGPGRGQAVRACVDKKACRIHWKDEMRAAKQAAKRRAQEPATKAGKAAVPEMQPPKELTDAWLHAELDTRCMGLIPSIREMASELVAIPDEVIYNLAAYVEHGAAVWDVIGGQSQQWGTDRAEACSQLLCTALPGEWKAWSGGWGDRRYPQVKDAVDAEARLYYLAARLCLARDTHEWDQEIQQALDARRLAWVAEQSAPAEKKAANPKKKLAGDVRRAKKKAKRRSS